MEKKFVVMMALIVVFTFAALAQAQDSKVINDAWAYVNGELSPITGDKGNGARLAMLPEVGKILFTQFFPAWDKSTMGGRVKYSVEYKGKKTDSGVLIADGSTRFVCVLGRSKPEIKPGNEGKEINTNIVTPAILGPNGTGPAICEWPYDGKAVNELMIAKIVVAGTEFQKYPQVTTPAWEQTDLYLGLADELYQKYGGTDTHPEGMMFITPFIVNGWNVSSAFSLLSKDGYQRAQDWAVENKKVFLKGGSWSPLGIAAGLGPKELKAPK